MQHIIANSLFFEGYQLKFSSPRAYSVYMVSGTVLANTADQFYVCVYLSFARMWRPLVHFITMLYYVAITFDR